MMEDISIDLLKTSNSFLFAYVRLVENFATEHYSLSDAILTKTSVSLYLMTGNKKRLYLKIVNQL